MNSYGEIIPLYIQHNDIQWDAHELVTSHYPIVNDCWEWQPGNFLILKKGSPKDYNLDPWNRKLRPWQFLDLDNHVVDCKGWGTMFNNRKSIADALYEIRYTTVEGKCIPLWKHENALCYV
jgi:hypothetical protein